MSSVPLNTQTPLTYTQWINYQNATIHETNEFLYVEYLQTWYKSQKNTRTENQKTLKEQYVQLLKDLNFLFKETTSDPFLKDINYDNEEELILAIPFFAKKLKEIANVLTNKRETVKRAKSRYNSIGSTEGLQSLLYEYILKSFTQNQGHISQIPVLAVQAKFPELSAIKNDFFVEIEELHEPHSYHDKNNLPSLDSLLKGEEYLDDYFPLMNVTDEMVYNIISSKILPRVSETTLSTLFKDYLTNVLQSNNSSDLTYQINAEIAATEKYLGEKVYGLTAVKVEDYTQPDYILNNTFTVGSNWFLWPTGYQTLTEKVYNNSYVPLNIQQSNLLASGATAGTDLTNSDIIFTDKNGVVEGAWLQGPYTEPRNGITDLTIKSGEITEFLYPYVGFELSPKSLTFKTHSLTGRDVKLFKTLTISQQLTTLSDYYTQTFPSTASRSIYLNQTNLISQGAYANAFSDAADSITRNPHSYTLPNVYNGEIEKAYLYKFDRTDLPIVTGNQNILWPVTTYSAGINLPITLNEETSLPVRLIDTNATYDFDGAVAGLTIDQADIIYKLDSNGDFTKAIEGAWLQSASINTLIRENINIYGPLSAVNCAHYIEGPIQGALSFNSAGGTRTSFVWCGPDTRADYVFKFTEHASGCPYVKTYPHDYYEDQDYINPDPLYDKNHWNKCTCKAVYYSPLGHAGQNFEDYNSLTDYVYADPFNLGDNFTLTGWRDTHGLDYRESPQFAFFQLSPNNKGDNVVGFGEGNWKTSDKKLSSVGDRLILKTGRKYVYCRSNLRIGASRNIQIPSFVSKFPYSTLKSSVPDDSNYYDIVIAWDISRSQTYNFEKIKKAVAELVKEATLTKSRKTQISVVTFGTKASFVSYLTTDSYSLSLMVDGVKQFDFQKDYTTNISGALQLSRILLTEPFPSSNNSLGTIAGVCNNLNTTIVNYLGLLKTVNSPNPKANKKIVLISDGIETAPTVNTLALADSIKKAGIEIMTVSLGELSITGSKMDQIASNKSNHFNLHKYLVSGDGDYDSFVSYVSHRVNGVVPSRPTWKKAIKNSTGNWIGTEIPSDMVLRPNDIIIYQHRSTIAYNDLYDLSTFVQVTSPFTINVKLDGWNYTTNSFSVTSVGPEMGGKPFWAIVPTDTVSMGGVVRFINEYVPIHQPDISGMVIHHADYLTYTRSPVPVNDLRWIQPLKMDESFEGNTWNEIVFDKTFSNLRDFLKTNIYDVMVDNTKILSNLLLESFSQYKPARYHYIARNALTYSEKLYLRNKCSNSYTSLVSGLVMEPLNPHQNLTNRYYPTIANVSFPSLAVTEKQTGGYLLPEFLGVSSYRGRGFEYEIDTNVLSKIDALSAERLFLDTQKYGSRNRGLTEEDQLSPITLKHTDNSWIMEPYSSGGKAGVLINTKENQKFTPYQTSYETLGYNKHGLSRQDDDFEFWNYDQPEPRWDQQNVDTSYRNEINDGVYQKRVGALLTNRGALVQWRTDIFGYDYGLYKHTESLNYEDMVYVHKDPPGITSFTSNISSSLLDLLTDTLLTFSVTVSGYAPYSYQWYKDDVVIPKGTLPTFTIYKTSIPDTGYYYCKISNIAGYTVTPTKTIIVRSKRGF